ncbi:MAG: alkaline phosphatase family protein, partial [Candidatus Latescibacteria bacterium]|nr:alkaline phosphatase family protein [Candidatus Latescibacterota bacterium]
RETGGTTLLAAHRKGVEGLPLDRLADQAIVVDGLRDDGIYTGARDAFVSDRPTLAVLHLIEIDEAGHAFGPRSAEVLRAAAETDRRLADLLALLADSGYSVLVTADHGMHEIAQNEKGERGTHDGSVEDDLWVPLVWASAEQLEELVDS